MAIWALALILFDQGSKWFLSKYQPSLVFLNQGIFLGLIKTNMVVSAFLLLGVAILVTLLIFQTKTKVPSWALWLIIAGIISNLIDRIFRGAVIDLTRFWILPAFNLADIFIIIGVIVSGYYLLRHK